MDSSPCASAAFLIFSEGLKVQTLIRSFDFRYVLFLQNKHFDQCITSVADRESLQPSFPLLQSLSISEIWVWSQLTAERVLRALVYDA